MTRQPGEPGTKTLMLETEPCRPGGTTESVEAAAFSPESATEDTEAVEGLNCPETIDVVDRAQPAELDTQVTELDQYSLENEAKESVWQRLCFSKSLIYGLLPGAALLLAMSVGYMKWQDGSARVAQLAGADAQLTATASTAAMLSYRPETVEKNLGAAHDRLTGDFLTKYASLMQKVVIPGSKEKNLAVQANVPAAAVVSATADRAVVLVFVDETAIAGSDPPTNAKSSIRVTLNKVSGRWLISEFEPL